MVRNVKQQRGTLSLQNFKKWFSQILRSVDFFSTKFNGIFFVNVCWVDTFLRGGGGEGEKFSGFLRVFRFLSGGGILNFKEVKFFTARPAQDGSFNKIIEIFLGGKT